MKKIFLFFIITLAFTAGAQEKKFFTPADASYNNRSLYASRPNQLKWVGDQEILMKVDGKNIVTMTPDGKHEATFSVSNGLVSCLTPLLFSEKA